MVFLVGALACTEKENAAASEPIGETSSEARLAVAIYQSDSCASDLVALVSPTTDCASLGSERAWGVKVGTECYDISDTTASAACTRYRAAANSEAIAVYHSDSCAQGDLLAYVDESTDCASMTISSNAWGVRINGVCSDIPDTSFASACSMFRNQVPGGVELFKSDSCGSDFIASIGPSTNCDTLAAATSSRVWAARFGGSCYDISDTTIKSACEAFKAAGSEGSIPLYHSDSCAGGDLIGVVGSTTNCSTIASVITSAVWGVQIAGVCNDITDTNVLNACTRFSGGGGPTPTSGVAVFDNDSCAGTPATLLQPTTNCTALASSIGGSARAVRVAGTCANIRDTTILDVCNRYKDVDP